jgi:hypothetical protein
LLFVCSVQPATCNLQNAVRYPSRFYSVHISCGLVRLA